MQFTSQRADGSLGDVTSTGVDGGVSVG
jgi:hypothetical protein